MTGQLIEAAVCGAAGAIAYDLAVAAVRRYRLRRAARIGRDR